MRAAVITAYGDPSTVRVEEVPTPTPGPGQVRIAVRAATVNPVDTFIRSGLAATIIEPDEPPLVAGWDVAGDVDALGQGVHDLTVGDRVIGLSHWFTGGHVGTHAEYVVLPADQVVHAPAGVDAVRAATLPVNGLAAGQLLDAAAPYAAGGTLLVTGGAGAVGAYAVELAARRGWTVLALAREPDIDLLTTLGAAGVVTDLQQLAAPVDVAIDAALLGDTVLPAVRDGGRVITLGDRFAVTPTRGITPQPLWMRADREALAALSAAPPLLRVAHDIPFEKAAEAHRLVEAGGLRGRVVLTF